ncbi:MAG: TolC family protein [Gemmatimonadaceae bacterium]
MIRTRSLLRAALVLLPGAAVAQSPVTLTLGGAARLAASQGGAATIARTRVAQADARVRQARSLLFPTISASAGQTQRNQNTATFGFSFRDATGKPVFDPNGEIIPPVTVLDLRGRAQANLLDFSVAAKLGTVRQQVRVAEAEAAGAGDQAAALAAAMYVRAVRADAVLSARLADSTLAAELLTIARDQVQAGVGVALDVTRARSQLSQAHAQLIGARADRDRARLELRRITGLDAGVELVLSDSLMALPFDATLPTADEGTRIALAHRADIRAVDEQKIAAERTVAATRLERLPTLGVFGDQGVIGPSSAHLLNTYTWGVQVSVPIFDGFRREGRLQEQHAQVREADARRRDLEAQAAIDVRAALLDLATAREMLAAADDRLALAQQELDQARARFTAGVSGNADVITASLGINAARTLVVDARASYQAARVTLARAEGTVTDLP